MSRLSLCALMLLTCAIALPAEAQLGRGDFRFSIDTDVLSMAAVEIDPDGPIGESEATVFGIGPNQVGGARATLSAPTPLGLGVGWVLSPKIVLGVRIGFGLDIIDGDGDDDSTRYLGLSLMPGLTFVPMGERAKLFLNMSPLFQISRVATEGTSNRFLLGGFGLGIGTLIFVANSLSVDLGFHFEGRFGGYEAENDNVIRVEGEGDVRDLRGVVRLGLSLWR